MALRYAVAHGNWSAPATWDGGTLPGAGDDVYANNKTVTIDQDVTCLSLRTTAGGAAAANGYFYAKSNDYPNAGATQACPGAVCGTASGATLTIDAMEFGSGGVVPISGRVFIRDAGTNFVKMRQSNLGSVTVIGEVANDYPAPTNVRAGIVYDFGAKVGTCAVPPAGSVALGVPVGATTGTAALSPAAIWSYDTRSLTEAPDVPTPTQIAAQVRTELGTELGRIDQPVSAAKTLTGDYDAAMTAASSTELAAAVSFILSNVPEGLTAAEVWAYVTRSLTQDVGLSPELTARLEQCSTVQTTGDQIAAMGV